MTRDGGWREQTLLLCALIGSAQVTWGAIVPALPLYLDEHGLAVGALGPILAAFAVGRALANTPAGIALRWWAPRGYLWTAALGLVAVTAVTGLATGTASIVLMRLLAGACGGVVVTVAFAVLVTAAPAERRGRVVAWSMMVMTGAVAVGALLGGLVVERYGVAATFVAAVVPLLLVLAWEAARPAGQYWTAYVAPEPEPPPVPQPEPVPGPPAVPGQRDGRRRLVAALCGVSFATFFVRFAGEQGLVPVMAYEGAGMRPATLSLAIAAGTVVSLLVAPGVGRLVDRGVRRPVLWVTGVVGAAAVAVLPFLGSAVLFSLALVAYVAATTALNVVPGVVTGEAWGPRESGGVVGLTRTVGDVGAALGPLLVFWLVERSSWAVACGLMAVVLLVPVVHLARRMQPDVLRREVVDA